jgi:hypothetical protein
MKCQRPPGATISEAVHLMDAVSKGDMSTRNLVSIRMAASPMMHCLWQNYSSRLVVYDHSPTNNYSKASKVGIGEVFSFSDFVLLQRTRNVKKAKDIKTRISVTFYARSGD